MRELPRLINDGADDFELSLLRSTDLDVGSKQALERTLSAVGLGSAVASGSASLSGTASSSPQAAALGAGASVGKHGVSAGLTAKWLGVGLVGLAALGGIWFNNRTPEARLTQTDRRALEAPSTPAQAPAGSQTASDPASQAVETVSVEDLQSDRATAEGNGRPELGADLGRAAKKKASAASLTDEIKAVSEIRESLANPTAALQAIGRYQQRFPRGRLQQEVTVLKIMALQRAGQSAQARSLGERFLAAYPTSAHAKRVRSVLGL